MTRNNDDRDELLMFGFIDGFWRKQCDERMQSFPLYLIKYIQDWICFEVIHIIGYNEDKSGTEHWEISVDDVLESKQPLKALCGCSPVHTCKDREALREKAGKIMDILKLHLEQNELANCKNIELLGIVQDSGHEKMTLPRLEQLLAVLVD